MAKKMPPGESQRRGLIRAVATQTIAAKAEATRREAIRSVVARTIKRPRPAAPATLRMSRDGLHIRYADGRRRIVARVHLLPESPIIN